MKSTPNPLANSLINSVFVICCLLLVGCAGMQPKLEQPKVKVAGLQLLPAQGFTQPIQVKLLIANPNERDLALRGMTYAIGIEDFEVLSGVSDQLPVLKSYQETPVTLVVTANVLQLLQLLEHFGSKGIQENVNYNFSAKLDYSAWLPSLRVNERGVIPLKSKR